MNACGLAAWATIAAILTLPLPPPYLIAGQTLCEHLAKGLSGSSVAVVGGQPPHCYGTYRCFGV